MPDLKLTAEIVERAKPSGRLVEFLDTNPRARGLALRIMPSGRNPGHCAIACRLETESGSPWGTTRPFLCRRRAIVLLLPLQPLLMAATRLN